MSGAAHPPGVAWWALPESFGMPQRGLWLWPQKLAFDPDQRLLLVADAHLGKALSFRRLGVPVPEATTQEALARLDAVIAATAPKELVFLGDLMHAPALQGSAVVPVVARWREQHSALAMTLVRGNHDRRSGAVPAAWGMAEVTGPWRREPWALLHEPQEVRGAYALAGHVHPGVALQGRARQRLRLPCFRFGPTVGLLPAFGPFTGLHVSPVAPAEQVLAVTDQSVVAVPGPPPTLAGCPTRPTPP